MPATRGDDDDGGIGTWCPEILLDDDPQVRELREDPGVQMVDHFLARSIGNWPRSGCPA